MTASPSMVDGGRPFQRLEGLPWLGIDDSDQAGCSNFDMATAIVRRTDERGLSVRKGTMVVKGRRANVGEIDAAVVLEFCSGDSRLIDGKRGTRT